MLQESDINAQTNVTDTKQLVPPPITELVRIAIQLHDLNYLRQLLTQHQKTTYTAEQLFNNSKQFNQLLRENAKANNNKIALELIKFGANVNHFAKLQIDAYQQVECYFLDMLVYWNNYVLFNAIGADKFDLSIYQVNQKYQHNLKNYKINTGFYDPDAPNITRKERRHKRHEFEINVMKRLFCCSIFCNWLVLHSRLDILQQLKSEYNTSEPNTKSTSCCGDPYSYATTKRNTYTIISSYENCIKKVVTSRYWFDLQNKLDIWMNLPYATYGVKLFISNPLIFDLMRLLPKHKFHAQKVAAALNTHYWQRYGMRSLMFLLCIPSGIAFTIGVLNIIAGNSQPETYMLAVLGSPLMLFAALECLQFLGLLCVPILSKNHLSIFGDSNSIALRMYTNTMLAEIIEPTNGLGETAREHNRSSNTIHYNDFFGFAFSRTNNKHNSIRNDQVLDELEMQALKPIARSKTVTI